LFSASDPHTAALDGDSAWRRHKLQKKATSRVNSRPTADGSYNGGLKSYERSEDVDVFDQLRDRSSYYDINDCTSGQEHITEIPVDDEAQPKSPYPQVLRHHPVERDPSPEPMLTTWNKNSLPMHGDIMLRVCAFQMNSFRPEISIEQASDITGFVWKESPCTILSYALCLSALGHLQSTTPGTGNDVIGMFKGKVFLEMIKQIPSMETSMSDELVPSIMCLTSYELSRVSLEARTHLQALRTIRLIEQQNVSPMFEGLDLIHSLMFDLPTVSQLETKCLPATRDVEDLFAYLREEQYDSLASKQSRLWSHIGEMLSHLESLMTDVLNGHPAEQSEADLFFEDLEHFRAEYCANRQQEEGQHVARCFYHICAILYNVLVNRRTLRNRSNKTHATGIYFATHGTRSNAWSTVLRLRLWLLAVALSASRDVGEQSLFQNHIATIVYQLGATDWAGVKHFLCSFLRIRSRLDEISRQARPTRRIAKVQLLNQSKFSASASSPVPIVQSKPISPADADMTTAPPPPTNMPHPTFIPLPPDTLTASVIRNAKIYPDLNEKYSFMPAVPVKNIMTQGYAYLRQERKFDSMLMKGDKGRISMVGTNVPDVGWVSLF
jgi:hypothetical protein